MPCANIAKPSLVKTGANKGSVIWSGDCVEGSGGPIEQGAHRLRVASYPEGATISVQPGTTDEAPFFLFYPCPPMSHSVSVEAEESMEFIGETWNFAYWLWYDAIGNPAQYADNPLTIDVSECSEVVAIYICDCEVSCADPCPAPLPSSMTMTINGFTYAENASLLRQGLGAYFSGKSYTCEAYQFPPNACQQWYAYDSGDLGHEANCLCDNPPCPTCSCAGFPGQGTVLLLAALDNDFCSVVATTATLFRVRAILRVITASDALGVRVYFQSMSVIVNYGIRHLYNDGSVRYEYCTGPQTGCGSTRTLWSSTSSVTPSTYFNTCAQRQAALTRNVTFNDLATLGTAVDITISP